MTELQRGVTGMQRTYYLHHAVLTGLTPGTDYSYRIFLDGENLTPDDELDFRTSGISPFKFVAVGDSGMGTEAQAQLAALMEKEEPRLLIHTGDLVYPTGTYERYETRYFDYYKSMMTDVPFFPCPGNHDYYETRAEPYFSIHDFPGGQVRDVDQGRYYSYDWHNAHFVSLDSNDTLAACARGLSPMLDWLEQDLAQTTKFWRIVYFHHPPFATGVNARDPLGVLVRDKIVPILEKYHVPVAFAGHEHSFQRTHPLLAGEMTDAANGIVYLTTGGGGARLYPFYPAPHVAAGASVHHYLRCDVNGAKMMVRAINADGEEIDRAVIAPPPLLSPASVVNSASFEPAVARGGLVSIFGMQLAPEDIVTSRKPLPRQVNGFRVLVNDEPLPLLMISPTQVNAVLPMNVAGSATLKVVTGNGSVETAIRIREVAPALFSTALFRADGRQIAEDAPAAAGEIVSVYGTGLGAVDGETAIDQPAAAAHPVVAPVRLLLDGAFMDPLSATLAEGLVGVYKITFGVPAVPAGTHSLRLEAGGETSNPVFLPITG